MPRIPNSENIQRRISTGSSSVVSINTGEVGRDLEEASKPLKILAERQNNFDLSKANMSFLKNKNEIERDLKNDPDYKTHDKRYQELMDKGITKFATGISDARSRADWINSAKMSTEKGRVHINNGAFEKETEFEMSEIEKDSDAAREIYLTGSPEDVEVAQSAYYSRLDTAFEKGYIDKDTIETEKTRWRNESAVAKLGMMAPEDVINALKMKWAKDLPSDVKIKLKNQAEDEFETDKAVSIVDDYIGQGLDQEEALIKFEKIKDKSLRKKVEARWDYDYNKAKDADTENQRELKDKFAYDVSKGLTTDEIQLNNPEEWDAMDSSTKMYLDSLQAESMKPVVRSNPDAVLHISELVAREDWRKAVEQIKSYSDQGILSSVDKIKYGKLAIDGQMPIELDSEISHIQAINASLTTAKIDDDDAKDLILHNLGKWRLDYIREHNKEPDDEARSKFIDGQLLMVPEADEGIFNDTEVQLYKISDKQWEFALQEIRKDEPEIAAKIMDYFNPQSTKDISAQTPEDTQTQRANPSRAEIMRVYHALKAE